MVSLVNGLGGSVGFGENILPANDDGSTSFIDLSTVFSSGLNFFGSTFSGLYLNNNGNVTFATSSSQYTPSQITGITGNPIIAAFFADVDTRGGTGIVSPGGTSTGSDLVYYDLDTTNHIFTATWDDVGYYDSHSELVNAFQIRLIQRTGPGFSAGDFDIEFRYEALNWTTGDASSGAGGGGGIVARAGYSSGNGTDYFELPQSGDQASMLNLANLTNTGTAGQFVFAVRSGTVVSFAVDASVSSIAEGNSGSTPVTFTITRSGSVASAADLSYVISGGVNAGDLNTPLTGAVHFDAGASTTTVTVNIRGDSIAEADELLSFDLTGLPDGTNSSGAASVTILNDDGAIITGTPNPDILTGTVANETIIGLDSGDRINGGGGNDRLLGGAGDDIYIITGAAGTVTIEDSVGTDTIDASAVGTGFTLNLNAGVNSTVGGTTIVLSTGGATSQPLDVQFLQDLTGSFSDDITTVTGIIPDVVAAIRAVQADSRFGISSFKDKPVAPSGDAGDFVYQTDLALTADASALATAYAALSATGGNDTPEAQIEALMQLALRGGTTEVGYRGDALRVVVLFTDAAYHVAGDGAAAGITTPNNGDAVLDGTPAGTGEDYPEIAQLAQALTAAGIYVVFAATSDNLAVYQDLSLQIGNATAVQLSADSSNIVNAITSGLATATATQIENAIGGAGNDTLIGNALDNTLSGLGGNDTLTGNDGRDILIGGVGNDTLDGGAGSDTASYVSSLGAVSVSLALSGAQNTFGAGTDTLISIENLAGSRFNDTLTGDGGANRIFGDNGNDVIDGGAGNDTLLGDAGNDQVKGGLGDDFMDGGDGIDEANYRGATGGVIVDLTNTGAQDTIGAGIDTLRNFENIAGSSFNDFIFGTNGSNVFLGGSGVDTVSYVYANNGVTVNLSNALAQITGAGTDRLNGIESLEGSFYDDKLTGDGGNNQLFGSFGNDVLEGLAGNDTLDGGLDTDTASYANATAGVTVNLFDTGPQQTGGAGIDTLLNIENLEGSAFNDRLTGDDFNNVIDGGDGNDELWGESGDDTLLGGRGDDILHNDISGYVDTLNGGDGNDTFVIDGNTGTAVVEDSNGTDTIDASALLEGFTLDMQGGTTSTIGSTTVMLAGGGTTTQPLDVQFLQDLTGSFSDDLANVTTLTPQIVAAIRAVQSDSRFGLSSFKDKPVSPMGGVGDFVYQTNLALTADASALASAYAAFTASGGGDTPEAQIEALMQLALRGATSEVGFRNDALRVVVLFTDATYHVAGDGAAGGITTPNNGDAVLNGTPAGSGEDYPAIAQLASALTAAGIFVVFAATSDSLSAYTGLAATLGNAAAVTLSSDSANIVDAITAGLTQATTVKIENAIGGEGNDTIFGNELANRIEGGEGADSLYGRSGDDTLVGWIGRDYLDGGDGNDTASYYDTPTGVTVDLSIVTAQRTSRVTGYDMLFSIENLTGSEFGDTLGGDSGANVLTGLAGDDILEGGDGNDKLDGGVGNDTAAYRTSAAGVNVSLAVAGPQNTIGAGTDTLISIENLIGSSYADQLTGNGGANRLEGGDGDDQLTGGLGDDTLVGGLGSDEASYRGLTAGVTVDLSLTTAQNTGAGGTDTLSDIENVAGTSFNDVFTGTSGNNRFLGGAGVDTVRYANAAAGVTVDLAITVAQNTIGAGSDTFSLIENLVGSAFGDTLRGDARDNVIEGGAGNDLIDGRGGIDTASYVSATSAVTVNLATLTAQGTGGAGTDTLAGIENLTGSAFSDFLLGDAANNVLVGAAGDDQLTGGLGNDTLVGGDGLDEASYRGLAAGVTVDLSLTTAQNTGGGGTDTLSGIENVAGTSFNDVFTGTSGNNRLLGGAGTDTVRYANASGGVTVDLALTTAQNTIGAGSDILSLIENLVGSSFDDTLRGDAGANVIEGGAANDLIDGRGGLDTASYASAGAGVTVNLATLTAQATGGAGTDTLAGIENLTGSAFADVLLGDGASNVLVGGAGDDQLTGGLGNDTLVGGAGIDEASYRGLAAGVTVDLALTTAQNTGGGGTDTLSEIENVVGTGFDDTLRGDGAANVIEGGAGNDLIDGRGGNDTASYASAGAGVTVNLATLTAQATLGAGTDTLAGIENLTGSAFADVLLGDGTSNVLVGGAGDDQLTGGLGNDTLVGGSGFDEASYRGLGAGVTVDLSLATAQNTGGGGTDTLSDIENVAGTTFNDVFTGTSGNNRFLGGSGLDTVRYANAAAGVTVDLGLTTAQNTIGAGSDTFSLIENLVGSSFNDTLLGDTTANTLDGGAGVNTLTGRGGADLFQFSVLETSVNRDVITDFAAGVDKFGFLRSAFAGFSGAPAGAFTAAQFALGTAATTASQRVVYDQTTGNVWYDADGSGVGAQVHIATLNAAPVLGAADFVLI